MQSRIDFDGSSYASAGGPLFGAGQGVAVTMENLVATLSGCTNMVGTHQAGQDYARAYDQSARQVVTAGRSMTIALQKMGQLVDAAAYNHALAEARSHPTGAPPPVRPSRSVVACTAASPPATVGGTGQTPSHWHELIDKVPGLEWPDADTGRLTAAAAAWDQAAAALDMYQSETRRAAGLLENTRSPEIGAGVAAIATLETNLGSLASQCRRLAAQLRAYGQQVDAARGRSEAIIAGVFAGLAVTAIAGIGLTWCTFGGSDVLAAAAAGSEIAAGAAEVGTVLATAAEGAAAVTGAVAEAEAGAAGIATAMAPFEAAAVETAEVVSAAGEGAAAAGADSAVAAAAQAAPGAAGAGGGAPTLLARAGRLGGRALDAYVQDQVFSHADDVQYRVEKAMGLNPPPVVHEHSAGDSAFAVAVGVLPGDRLAKGVAAINRPVLRWTEQTLTTEGSGAVQTALARRPALIAARNAAEADLKTALKGTGRPMKDFNADRLDATLVELQEAGMSRRARRAIEAKATALITARREVRDVGAWVGETGGEDLLRQQGYNIPRAFRVSNGTPPGGMLDSLAVKHTPGHTTIAVSEFKGLGARLDKKLRDTLLEGKAAQGSAPYMRDRFWRDHRVVEYMAENPDVWARVRNGEATFVGKVIHTRGDGTVRMSESSFNLTAEVVNELQRAINVRLGK